MGRETGGLNATRKTARPKPNIIYGGTMKTYQITEQDIAKKEINDLAEQYGKEIE
jgi:hypothetical protein